MKNIIIGYIASLQNKPKSIALPVLAAHGISYRVRTVTPSIVEYWSVLYGIKGTINIAN